MRRPDARLTQSGAAVPLPRAASFQERIDHGRISARLRLWLASA
ncbi:hypothetical protein roselon_00434 [Roseibacterium elongatum DSM 19469]|uniref:Uncharacterized protein n=1 Tax=Roseicyclus elongatus DSM 19469 TaxID=1294273 RepID=W8RP03_9RHOB|nr:hypothetical protein roselon_00434 [Roseibacterium elongatum DSM 19469]